MKLIHSSFLILTLLVPSLFAEDGLLLPAENLQVVNIPPIPGQLVEEVNRYTEFRSAGFADWHPVKREMLIATRFADSTQIHHVAMPGGARTQLTFFPDPVGSASFEPVTGDYIVITKDSGGDEFYQNYRFDLNSGRTTLLTDGKKRNSPGRWSNSGKLMVYRRVDANDAGAFTEIRLVGPDNPKSDRLLLKLEGGGWGIDDWSPDDSTLLASESISVNESYLWTIDAETGEKTLLTPRKTEKVSYGGAQYSRDGKNIFLTTDLDHEFMRLGKMEASGGPIEFITKDAEWDVTGIDLSRDGRKLAFLTNEAGISKLHILDTRSGKFRQPADIPVGIIGGLDWHNNSEDLAFTLSSSGSTGDVYSLNVKTNKIDRWTLSELGGLNGSEFVKPELIEWKTFDGLKISGFLYMPPSRFAGARPVIINIHGGPEGQSRPGFQGRNNYFLNEMGIAIIYPNVRGSSGYGKTFVALDNGFKREDTYRDIESLLDWIAQESRLDKNRIMVTGGSYGGHMTLAVATRYNDRIACSVDVVGISNLRTFLQNTQGYRRDLRRVEYGDERDPTMMEFLEKIAPLNMADKITKPMFVIQGANDPRVPKSEADQMVQTLTRNGTPVWYLVAGDEGHGFRKKSNADYQFYATVMFIRKHLLSESN